MAAGVPVVASDIGGVDEQIRDGETGVLVPAGDAGALARAIIALADDPSRRRLLGDAGRRHVRTTFTYERQARGLREAYLAALGLRGR
jgi:glycosyltransferase involved in cell wall biosynthesis